MLFVAEVVVKSLNIISHIAGSEAALLVHVRSVLEAVVFESTMSLGFGQVGVTSIWKLSMYK